MKASATVLAFCLTFQLGTAHPPRGWNLRSFKTLVTFGDSYTDEGRLGYFINNNGEAPPVGYEQPVGTNTASGGLAWARYASIYTHTRLYNYAVSGAVCSNTITPRFFSAIKAPFPSITTYELPAFLTEFTLNKKGKKFFTGKPSDTVYAIWIGTNDLGNDAFLTDSQVPGKTLTDYVDCVYGVIETLKRKAGGRYFVLMNLAPLERLPQYALLENGGRAATQFFNDKPNYNGTALHYRIRENVATVNSIFDYRTPFETEVSERLDVKIANFDVNGLLVDMYEQSGRYLNGTAPPNVQGVVNECDENGDECVRNGSPDSFLWFDELHPSEQTSRVVAREFKNVLSGRSKWAKYWG